MPPLAIDSTQVKLVGSIPQLTYLAGATLKAGQGVYLDRAAQVWQLTTCQGTVEQAEMYGVALANVGINQPCSAGIGGLLDLGAAANVQPGTVYVVGVGGGEFLPAGELITSGWYSTVAVIGVDNTTGRVHIIPFPSRAQVP